MLTTSNLETLIKRTGNFSRIVGGLTQFFLILILLVGSSFQLELPIVSFVISSIIAIGFIILGQKIYKKPEPARSQELWGILGLCVANFALTTAQHLKPSVLIMSVVIVVGYTLYQVRGSQKK